MVVSYVFLYVVVVFFKQKTAYEMRISDWSSDVCSSDLAHISDRPARIQHRGGRLWILNSAALNELLAGEGAPPPAGLEIRNGWPTGRLYDADDWVRVRLSGPWPSRSEERRVGKECVCKCRSRWSPYH